MSTKNANSYYKLKNLNTQTDEIQNDLDDLILAVSGMDVIPENDVITSLGERYVLVQNASGINSWVLDTSRYEDSLEPRGFTEGSRDTSTLSVNDTTMKLTISGTFSFWAGGKRFEIEDDVRTVDWDAYEGMHYFYFDASGVLQHSKSFDVGYIKENCYVAATYWDTDNLETIYLGDERHGCSMDWATHVYLHNVHGTEFVTGLALGDLLPDENGSSDTHAQVGVEAGTIYDEDLIHNSTIQSAPASIPVFYKSDSSGKWRRQTATNFPVIQHPGGLLAYNEWTGVTWQQTEVTSGQYVLAHIFATNDASQPVISIQGQDTYTTIIAARAGAKVEINSLVVAGLPFEEFVPIATIIYQTRTSYTNSVRSRIVSTDEGDAYVDFRTLALTAGAGGLNDHGNLQGLGDDDHLQYTRADGTRAFTGTVSGVYPTDTNHLSTKQYVDYVNSNLAAYVVANHYTTAQYVVSGGTSGPIKTTDAGYLDDSMLKSTAVTQHQSSIDHNSLDNLDTGDVHTQYVLADGSRAITNPITMDGAIGESYNSRLRQMSILPNGYVENAPINFRFDQDCLAYVNRWGGTAEVTYSAGLTDTYMDYLFSQRTRFIDIANCGQPSYTIEVSGISISNSQPRSFWPYVFLHAEEGSLDVVVEFYKAGVWIPAYSGTVTSYHVEQFTSPTNDPLEGVRWTIVPSGTHCYLRGLGVIARNGEDYQFTVGRDGDTIYGDLDFQNGAAPLISGHAPDTHDEALATVSYVNSEISSAIPTLPGNFSSIAVNTDPGGTWADGVADLDPSSPVSTLYLTTSGGITIESTETPNYGIKIDHADTSTVGNLSASGSGNYVLQGIAAEFDDYGHVTSIAANTKNLDAEYYGQGDFIDVFGGAVRPVKTNGDGYIDSTLVTGIVTDHGSLGGLTTGDPHTQYVLADGSRAFTNPVVGRDPTLSEHLATRHYVDGTITDSFSRIYVNDNNSATAWNSGIGAGVVADSSDDDLYIYSATGISLSVDSGNANVIKIDHVANAGKPKDIRVNNSNGIVLQDLTIEVDDFGHVTNLTSANASLDVRYYQKSVFVDLGGLGKAWPILTTAAGYLHESFLTSTAVTQFNDELEAILVHNNLQGLTTGDPHTQYVLADGSRAVSSGLTVSGLNTYDDVNLNGNVIYTDMYNNSLIENTTGNIDWNNGNIQKVIVGGTVTLTFTNPPGACKLLLEVGVNADGSTVSFPTGINWPGGTAPTITPTRTRTDIIEFYFNGVEYFGTYNQNLY